MTGLARRGAGGARQRTGRAAAGAPIALATAIVAATLGAAARAGAQEHLARIATGIEGGTYDLVGRALAKAIDDNAAGVIRVEVLPSAGSIANIRMLLEGQAEFALVQADVLYAATREGQKGDESLRAVGALMPEAIHVLVREGSKIQSLEDLAGARVSAGPPGSGSQASFIDLLAAHRLKESEVERRYLADDVAAEQLLKGELDAWVVTVPAPSARVAKVLATGKAKLIPIAPDVLQSLASESPYMRSGAIPPGSYPGVTVDLPTALIQTVVATRKGVQPVIVSEVLRVMHHQRDRLGAAHPRAEGYGLAETAADLPISMHEAAVAYFQANRSIQLPVQAYVGVYVLDIGGLDLKAGTFHADFYLWFRWRGPYLQAVEDGFDFEIVNGSILETSSPVLERLGAWSYVNYRVKAELRGNFPLHNYPFDRQRLAIEIESPTFNADQVVFIPDDRRQFADDLRQRSLDDELVISDWRIGAVRHYGMVKEYKTDFGSPLEEAGDGAAYSRYVFEVDVERELMPYVVKFVVPLIVIVLMSFCVFYIHPQEFEVQAGIVITALLSCVAFHISQVDALPEVGYLVAADKFFLLSYVIIFLALVQLVAENHLFHHGNLAAAHRLDFWSRILFPLCFFGLIGYLGWSANEPLAASSDRGRPSDAREEVREDGRDRPRRPGLAVQGGPR